MTSKNYSEYWAAKIRLREKWNASNYIDLWCSTRPLKDTNKTSYASFNGTSSFLNLGHSVQRFNSNAGAYSFFVEFDWGRSTFEDASDLDSFIAIRDGSNYIYIRMQRHNTLYNLQGRLRIQHGSAGVPSEIYSNGHALYPVLDGKKHKILVNHTGTNTTAYLDDTVIINNLAHTTNGVAASSDVYVGQSGYSSSYFKGNIYKLGFWRNGTTTMAQASDLIETDAEILFAMQGNATDFSGQGNDGASSSMTFYQSSDVLTSGAYAFPIIENMQIQQKMDGYIPATSQGKIILNNTKNSLAIDRQFSDYLEKYTPIAQTIDIYKAIVPVDNKETNPNFTLVCSDVIKGYKFNGRDNSITLDLRSNPLPEKTTTYEIQKEIFTNVPANAISKNVPLVFGSDVEVDTVNVGGDGTYEGYFCYGTTFSTKFINDGVQNYYAKNNSGEYEEISSATTTTTDHYGYGFSSYGGTYSYFEINKETFIPFHPSYSFSTPYKVVYGCVVKIHEDSYTNSGWEGKISVKIYQSLTNDGFSSSLGQGSVDKSTYSASFGTAFDIYIPFDKPIVLHTYGGQPWISVVNSTSDEDNGVVYVAAEVPSGTPISGYLGLWRKIQQSNELVFSPYFEVGDASPQGNYIPRIKIYCLKLTDTTTPHTSARDEANGLATSYIKVERDSSNFSDPDIQDLQMQVKIDGLRDDSSGSITGTAYQLLVSAHHIVELLCAWDWNGTSWVDSGRFDASFQSDSHDQLTLAGSGYPRIITGSTTNRMTNSQVISEICRNNACWLVHIPSTGKLGLYAWGLPVDTTEVLTDADIQLQEFYAEFDGAILNDIKVNYNKKVINVSFNEFVRIFYKTRSNSQTYVLNHSNNSALLGESFDTFGVRDLRDNIFNFIGDAVSAESVANFLARTYDFPAEFSNIVVLHNQYPDLKPFDVVALTSSKLPSDIGTNSNPNKLSYLDPKYCLTFSGNQNTYIDCGSSIDGVHSSLTDVAFYAKVKLDIYMGNPATSTNYQLFDCLSGSYNSGFGLRVLGSSGNYGKIQFQSGNATSYYESDSANQTFTNDLEWHELKGYFKSSDASNTIKIWFDGTLVIDSTIAKPATSVTAFKIGRSAQSWYGKIKHLAIWKSVPDNYDIYNKKDLVLLVDGNDRS